MRALLADNPNAKDIELLALSLATDETTFSTPYVREGSGSNAEKLRVITSQIGDDFTLFSEDVDYAALARIEDAGGAAQLLAYIADLRHQLLSKVDALHLFSADRGLLLALLNRELCWGIRGRALLSLHPVGYSERNQNSTQRKYM